jgi:nucleotide-binding universal stress UspA family protein
MTGLNILVPLDSSKISDKTINTLFALKAKINGHLTLLHVFDPDRVYYKGETLVNFSMIEERAKKAAEQFLEEKKALFAAEGIVVETLLKVGPSRKTICEVADSGKFDLLIIGRHTEGELRNLLFGQVSNYVIHKVKCPVIIL